MNPLYSRLPFCRTPFSTRSTDSRRFFSGSPFFFLPSPNRGQDIDVQVQNSHYHALARTAFRVSSLLAGDGNCSDGILISSPDADRHGAASTPSASASGPG